MYSTSLCTVVPMFVLLLPGQTIDSIALADPAGGILVTETTLFEIVRLSERQRANQLGSFSVLIWLDNQIKLTLFRLCLFGLHGLHGNEGAVLVFTMEAVRKLLGRGIYRLVKKSTELLTWSA